MPAQRTICWLPILVTFFFFPRHVAASDSSRGLPLRCPGRCSSDDSCLSACEECERACHERRCRRGLQLCTFSYLPPTYLCNIQYNKSGKCSVPAPLLKIPSDGLGGGDSPAPAPAADPPLSTAYISPAGGTPLPSGGDDFKVSRLSRSSFDIPVILLIVVGLVATALISMNIMSRYGCLACPAEQPSETPKPDSLRVVKSAELIKLLSQPLHAFTLKELCSATKNFSPSNLLGDGGAGPVYKATLPNKTVVAVRLLADASSASMRDFYKEINSVAKIEHRNLVPIRGCCVEEGQRWLIFDYYPNGSLQEAIFGQKSTTLTWLQCREIMLGTARGISHLHHSCEPKVIHKEIHPGNVLLDSNFKAHVADFGLRGPPREIDLRRAYTYMCPVYSLTGHLTEKCDVYSLGMLMLAMISGQSPMTPSSKYMSLVEMASAYINDSKLLEFVNPKFQAQYYMSEVVSYVSVAMMCVQQDPIRRPSMLEVVSMLEGSKNMAPPISRKATKPPLPRPPKQSPQRFQLYY